MAKVPVIDFSKQDLLQPGSPEWNSSQKGSWTVKKGQTQAGLIVKVNREKIKREMEKWGIDPHTSRMLSERSTI
ncbi:hypothetical protein V6N11_033615 [Hibiscus sabdariffa]|uniref:Uncharacterized protein n=1 Tax=Hibiscus sabdariffa TaxID=183260 RepID=A0ABR2PYL4_9ROSI